MKWAVPLVVGVGILTTIIVAFVMLSKPNPLVGTWYARFGRVITFKADGTYYDDYHPTYDEAGRPLPRKYIISGNTYQVFFPGRDPATYIWSMNLDGQSINVTEGGSTDTLYRTPSPSEPPTNTGSGSGSMSGTGGGAEIESPSRSNTGSNGGTSDAGDTLLRLADQQNARLNKYRNP